MKITNYLILLFLTISVSAQASGVPDVETIYAGEGHFYDIDSKTNLPTPTEAKALREETLREAKIIGMKDYGVNRFTIHDDTYQAVCTPPRFNYGYQRYMATCLASVIISKSN